MSNYGIQSQNNKTWFSMDVSWNHDFSQTHPTLSHSRLFLSKLPKLRSLSLSVFPFCSLFFSALLTSKFVYSYTATTVQKDQSFSDFQHTEKHVFLTYIYMYFSLPHIRYVGFPLFTLIHSLVSYPTYRRTVRPVSIYILSHYPLCM